MKIIIELNNTKFLISKQMSKKMCILIAITDYLNEARIKAMEREQKH